MPDTVATVNGEIAEALAGFEATGQGAVDMARIELDGIADKSRLRANATLGASLVWHGRPES